MTDLFEKYMLNHFSLVETFSKKVSYDLGPKHLKNVKSVLVLVRYNYKELDNYMEEKMSVLTELAL